MADNVAITAGSGTTVATNEESIASTNVQVQRVRDMGSTDLANGQVAPTSTAGTIVAARDTRKTVTILNIGTVDVYVGVATVTTSNGFKLSPGASVELKTKALIQGIVSGSTNGSVCYWEEYDA